MLNQWFANPILLGIAQAIVVIVLALGVIELSRRRHIHIERDALTALARGIIQVVLVGAVLVLAFRGPYWTAFLILSGMILVAATIAARRARGMPGALQAALGGIGLGAGFVIISMTWIGAIDAAMTTLIPVGSMLITSAMNASALAMDRFRGEVEAHAAQVEAALALGAETHKTVEPHSQAAMKASLIPRIDLLRSLGIVWIPGLMAGMILSGVNPIYAALYQFVVITMSFATAGLTSLISVLLIRTYAFSPAEQLLLRRNIYIETSD